ncbi:MAG: LabA-like NYN domain-containing protein [Candidatus Limnocylindrales bacterium]
MGKNVAVFVDVANIFYAAKSAGVDIDYVTMLKSATAGRDLVRAYAYTGLDPDNENQRNFHDFLRRHGYKVVSKDIRKYGDGKVKANLDIELVVDMMKTARNLDIAIVVSGDGDFAPAIRAVQEMGVRCEVISFRGNTSSDLIEVADLFTDITQIAKVEKGSSRSGRRVATDDEDLSMTEVPDKQTEGTGAGRGRTRRGRTSDGERPVTAERPVAAERASGRGRSRPAAVADEGSAAASTRPAMVALPGEKLSRVRPVAAVVAAPEDVVEERLGPADEILGEDGRRRRRRGGRGRGRGRGRAEGELVTPGSTVERDDRGVEVLAAEQPVAPRTAKPAAFGSVWDSQLGQRQTPSPRRDAALDEEFDDEPAIPEYLIAERHGGTRSTGRTGGARGVRSGYAAAVDRERFGNRSGGGLTGGINRYPDVSGRSGPRTEGVRRDVGRRDERGAGQGPGRSDRPDRIGGAPRPGEGWSEVPPELEAMLRAQLAAGVGNRPRPSGLAVPAGSAVPAPAGATDVAAPKARGPRRPRVSTEPVDAVPTTAAIAERTSAGGSASTTAEPAARRRPTRARTSGTPADQSNVPIPSTPSAGDQPMARRRTTRAKASETATAVDAPVASPPPDTAIPKAVTRRAVRAKAVPTEG